MTGELFFLVVAVYVLGGVAASGYLHDRLRLPAPLVWVGSFLWPLVLLRFIIIGLVQLVVWIFTGEVK